MKTLFILLPTKFETNDIIKHLGKYMLFITKNIKSCTFLNDDFLNPLKCDDFEDDTYINLKLKIFEKMNIPKHCFIIIISDYQTACMIEKQNLFVHVPSDEYLNKIVFNRNDYSDIINRTNDIVYPTLKIRAYEYNSLDELLENIKYCFDNIRYPD